MAIEMFSELLSTLGEAAGTAAENYVRSLNPLAPFIRAANLAGMSGRATLEAYRSIGGTIGNQTFWNLRKSVLSAPIDGVPMSSLLSGDKSSINALPGGKAGQFRYDFTVHVMRLGPDGKPEYSTTQFTMLQNEYDPEEAMNAMSQVAANMYDPESESGKWMGFELSRISQYTG